MITGQCQMALLPGPRRQAYVYCAGEYRHRGGRARSLDLSDLSMTELPGAGHVERGDWRSRQRRRSGSACAGLLDMFQI